jgi:hypothetical protein
MLSMLVEIVPRAFSHTHHGEQYHHRFDCLCQGRSVFAGFGSRREFGREAGTDTAARDDNH